MGEVERLKDELDSMTVSYEDTEDDVEAQVEEIGKLQDEIKRLKGDEKDCPVCGRGSKVSTLATLQMCFCCAQERISEVDRLRALMMKQVDDSPCDVNIGNGEAEINIRPPHWAAIAMAESFVDTLGDAPNWRCLELRPQVAGIIPLVVTVRRLTGDSPEETVTKCKDLLESWYEMYCGEKNGDEDLRKRTLAILNPTKKESAV